MTAAVPTSTLYRYSLFRDGLGKTTDPGSESNTLPTSSILGARNPVDKLEKSCQVGVGLNTTPILPVKAPDWL